MFKTLRFVLLLLVVFSCNKNQEESNSDSEVPKNEWFSMETDELINEVFGGKEGTIRGFDLGDPKAKIVELENLEKFEESENELAYTFESEDFELVDVYYGFDTNESLSEVQVDIYLNADSTSNEMLTAIEKYFTQKYGKPQELEGDSLWKVNSNGEVLVKKVNSKLDRGLQINYRKASL